MTESTANVVNDMERELQCSVCLSLIEQAMSTCCAHIFCSLCIQLKESCPTCEKKEIKSYPVPHVDVIVQEFIKIKQSFNTVSVEDPPTLTHAQEVQEQRQKETTPEEGVVQKECFVVKKGEHPTLNVPGMHWVPKVTAQTTHLVLSADEQNCVDRSFIYYLGILYGCFIVNEKWLENCNKRGHVVPETRYEISGDKIMGRTGAPEKGRRNKEAKSPRLFEGLRMAIVEDDLQRQMETCFKAGGGEVEGEGEQVIVCGENPEGWKEAGDKKCVRKEWLLDSICNFELLKMEDYCVRWVTQK